jgi:hypothetical protein
VEPDIGIPGWAIDICLPNHVCEDVLLDLNRKPKKRMEEWADYYSVLSKRFLSQGVIIRPWI